MHGVHKMAIGHHVMFHYYFCNFSFKLSMDMHKGVANIIIKLIKVGPEQLTMAGCGGALLSSGTSRVAPGSKL